ncbi:aftiphilin-like isoform X1 [Acipenser ruthenus]|uniref:aftiphilin-like isoform X1 n=1 Tax=Acipenser ruthenus TaxID=7906 RepID=UPI00274227F7|nr:aftiphilin-like isoform X1 [Acipenser ruthenus]
MDPEVIRMYSSSPPPLDDGAEEEDDEFGEFGGFSGITSSVSLTEFSTQRVDFVPQNHFMPAKDYSNNVDSFEDFDSISVSKDQGLIAEISKQFVETRTINEISPTSKPASFSIDGPAGKEGVKRPVDQTESATSSNSSMAPVSSRTDVKIQPHQTQSCNGTVVPDAEVLTNGFAAFDIPGKQANIINSKGQKEITEELSLDSTSSPSNEFADFSAFPKADASDNCIQTMKHMEDSSEGKTLTCPVSFVTNSVNELNIPKEELAGVSLENEGVRDTDSTGSDLLVDGISNGEGDLETVVEPKPVTCRMQQKETATVYPDKEVTCRPVAQNGQEEIGALESGVCESSVLPSVEGSTEAEQHQPVDNEVGENGELGDSAPPSTSVSVSEDFASFCQAASPDDQDGFGDFGTTSITSSRLMSKDVPSLSFNPEEPEEHFATFEELSSDEDFGDFGEVRDSSKQSFADFNQPKVDTALLDKPVDSKSESEFADLPPQKELKDELKEGFGDFDSTPKPKESEFADFPGSDSFADFSSATGSQNAEWNAFGEQQSQSKSTSWAAFGEEQTAASIEGDVWQTSTGVTAPTAGSPQISRKEVAAFASFQGTEDIGSNLETEPALQQASLVSRLELVFQACFPSAPVLRADEEIPSLKVFLEPEEHRLKKAQALAQHGELLEVWTELQDIHDAYGLRYQWGGSHSNKKLLCSLGIDTRNILFTGQKKQPVIVPMYAASLGMLEPTKEPVKPVSAAEKIASIAQTPPVSPEMNTCTQDQTQENLPPVQFDWSSSGLTNPLDASGGSTLLNLDFFGPVDDTSSSSTTSIPGVDPELYELTTSKLESSSTSSHVADAFARLMSTVEKTSTSARKPKTDENLSEEAAKVIASLPDLFFMQAKVLMFPTTLTPLTCSQEHAD